MLSSTIMSVAAQKAPPNQVLAAYAMFIGSALAMYHMVANGEFSSILTLAVMLQCLAFTLLSLQTLMTGHVAGISARALALDAVALIFRLSSTTWLQGYLPVDASGDWLYQATDMVSLLLVAWLLSCVLAERHHAQEDSCPIVPVALVAFLLAALFHADMNARPMFDTL